MIAIFYSSGIGVAGLAVAAGGVLLIFLMQKLGVRSPWAYVLAGHRDLGRRRTWAASTRRSRASSSVSRTPIRAWPQREAESPGERLQRSLHGWVAFAIMPVFALANAGVSLDARPPLGRRGDRAHRRGRRPRGGQAGRDHGGVVAGRALRAGGAALGRAAGSGVLVVGLVAGIGFTMALFIATLAFPPGPLIEVAKLGILLASLVAGAVGLVVGRFLFPAARAQP